MRTSNPILSDKVFNSAAQDASLAAQGPMTIQGTVNKTFILLGLVIASAGYTWYKVFSGNMGAAQGFMILGAIVGFILAMVTAFKPHLASKTTPAYAIAEGLFIGGLSATMEAMYPGIVIQAVGLTFGTLFCLLGVYKTGMIKVTDNFRMGLMSAMGAIFLVYVVSFVLSLFGFNLSMVYGNGPLGIVFSLIIVGVAALNLVLDFDFIEKGAQSGAPKHMEWFGAFGLMVTLIWLYVEILRLLSKFRSRD